MTADGKGWLAYADHLDREADRRGTGYLRGIAADIRREVGKGKA
jgi:hypothetical protein